MMEIVERAALLVEDKLTARRAGYRKCVRAQVTIDNGSELRRRDRRVDLGLQSLHLQVGLLKCERGRLQLLIGALQLLRGGLDPRVFGLELLDLDLERENDLAVAL